MRIGFQGMGGSHAEYAAERFIWKKGLDRQQNAELVPLLTSVRVMDALQRGEIDYGVVAIRDSQEQVIKETEDALEEASFRKVASFRLPVHSCIFVMPGVSAGEIHRVVSHPASLLLCRSRWQAAFPGAVAEPYADTAMAARDLAGGKLPGECAVICRRETGLRSGLSLLCENAEDSSRANIEFWLLQR